MSWRYFLLFGGLITHNALAMDSYEQLNNMEDNTSIAVAEDVEATTRETRANDITISTNVTTPYNLSSSTSHNFTIQSGASLITTAGMSNLNQSNAITITNAPKKITNYGQIISNVVEAAYDKAVLIENNKAYAIFINDGAVKNGSFLDNYGDVILKLNIAKGEAAPKENSLDLFYSGSAAYINVNENKGMILADVDMAAGKAYNASGRARAYAEAKWTGIGVYGSVKNNNGLIISDFDFRSGSSTSTLRLNQDKSYCYQTDTCAPVRVDYSGNAVHGNVTNNNTYIVARSDVSGGIVKNNRTGSYAAAELLFRESGNAVFGNVTHNKGIIHSSSNLIGSSASAEDHIGGDFEVYSRGSSNGVHGNVENNEGLISGNALLNPQDMDVPKANIYIRDIRSGNGIFGNVQNNSGTLKGFVDYRPGVKLGVTNPIYAFMTGSGIAYNPGSSINTVNQGRIIGNRSAVSIDAADISNAQFYNYGILAGPEAFSRPSDDGLKIIPVSLPKAQNYGIYLKTDAQGNVKQVIQGGSGVYDGRETVQTPIYGGIDAYKIYGSSSAPITNKIINGVGTASGVVTLKEFKGDFKIDNSVINAYDTALSYKDSRIVTLKDSKINGGGTRTAATNAKTRENSFIVDSIIKGDDTSNGLVLLGNTVINGNSELGGGNDIFVFDHQNAKINGRIDLGEGDKDTFALYEFSGDGDKFLPLIKREAFHGKANNILGDKVIGQEFLGLQRGLLTLKNPGDYTDYGLYVGGQAKATFTENQDYMLKGLLNFGTISLKDNSTNDNLTIKEDAYLSGIVEKDTNFNNTSADKITVLGNLAGNTKIRIIGIGDGKPSETSKTLIMAPNDNNRYDEYFTFVEEQRYQGLSNKGRFNGSPHPWYLLAAGNEWFLSPVNEGGDAGGNSGGGNSGGGDGGNSGGGLGDLGDLGGIGGDIDGGNTGGGNGGTGGGGDTGTDTGVDVGTGLEPETGGNGDKIEILAEIPAYISLMNIAQEIAENDIGILYSRLSKVRKEGRLKTYTPLSPIGSWMRAGANKFSFDEGELFDLSGSYESFDGGIDKIFAISKSWASVLGVSLGYKTGKFETKASQNQDYVTTAKADINTKALALGLYASAFNQAGSFVNLTAKYIDYTADINAAGLSSSANGYMFVGALAGGHQFDISKNWSLEPMAQLDLGYIRWNDFYDGFNQISYDDQYYASARLGLRVENTININKALSLESWAYAGVAEDMANESKLYFSYDEFPINDYGFKSEFEGGFTLKHKQNLEFHLEAGYASNFESYDAIRGDVGLRVIW